MNRGPAKPPSTGAGLARLESEGSKNMTLLRVPIVALSAGVLLTSVSLCNPAVAAQDKQQTSDTTTTTKTDTTTTTGFPTGTICKKTGIYRAGNKYLDVILVVEEGELFPPFADGQNITWYTLTRSAKDTFDAVKVSPGSN